MLTNKILFAILTLAPYIGQHDQQRLRLTYTTPVASEIIVQVQTGTNTFKDYMLTLATKAGTNTVSFDAPAESSLYRLRMK